MEDKEVLPVMMELPHTFPREPVGRGEGDGGREEEVGEGGERDVAGEGVIAARAGGLELQRVAMVS